MRTFAAPLVWSNNVASAEHLIGAMRFLLSLWSLWFVLFILDVPHLQKRLLVAALLVYTLHSALVLVWTLYWRRPLPPLRVLLVGGDLFYYSLLIAWSGGADSAFFGWYFFAVIAASYQWGFSGGTYAAISAALSFVAAVVLAAPAMAAELISHKTLLHLLLLLTLGYLIAHWGEYELRLRGRLGLLQEVTQLANPRFGIAHAVGAVMRRLCEFYAAERCWLITYDPFSGEYRCQSAEPGGIGQDMLGGVLEGDVARALLAIPAHWTLMRASRRAGLRAVDYASGQIIEANVQLESVERSLPPALATEPFLSIPIRCQGEANGRLFLVTRRRSPGWADVELLRQIVAQVMPVVENVHLMDRLATYAARPELSSGSLETLRHAWDGAGRQKNGLVAAVRYGAAKFAEESGIRMTVEADDNLHVDDRLAAEAFSLIAEGLSNIRLHTRARRGRIVLRTAPRRLLLRIENENFPSSGAISPDEKAPDAASREAASFTPRTIMARVEALGGSVHVERTVYNTGVHIELPRVAGEEEESSKSPAGSASPSSQTR